MPARIADLFRHSISGRQTFGAVCAAAHCRQSHGGSLGGTVATVDFPDIGLQGFAPKLAGI
jgi:hypothetical protein